MNREQKQQVVEQYKGIFAEHSMIVLAEYAGVSVNEISTLRKDLYKSDSQIKIVKNRLAKIALSDSENQDVLNEFVGPISVAYSNNPVELAKSLTDFTKKNEKLKIKYAVMDSNILTIEQVKALSELPSLDELRAKLLSVIMAPARQVATVINEVPSSLARVIKARSDS